MHDQSITTSEFVSVGAFNSEMLVLKRMRIFYSENNDNLNLAFIKTRYNNFLLKLLYGKNYKFYFKGLWYGEINVFKKVILTLIFPLYVLTNRGTIITKKIMNQ
jgi:hypothetical protein